MTLQQNLSLILGIYSKVPTYLMEDECRME